jgi:hypothetical protein
MPRDITVTLQDGSTHVYKNAPDDITPDAVTARASKDFGQSVAHLDGGRPGGAPPDVASDVLKSLPTGLAEGVTGMVGLPGTISDLAQGALTKGMNAITGANVQLPGDPLSGSALMGDVNKAVPGGMYQAQTTPGKFAQTAASFVPAAFGGEASLAQRALGRVLAPAAGSMAGGSVVSEEQSPFLHGVGQLLGTILGGGLAGGAKQLGDLIPSASEAPGDAAEKYLAKMAADAQVTPQDILDNAATKGRGQLGAEAFGPDGVATLASLGRRGGTTGQALTDTLTTRLATAPSRVMDDFTAGSGIDPRGAAGDIDSMVDSGRAAAKPLYDQALSQPGGVMTPDLESLASRPIIQKAMAQAATDIRNDGRDPNAMGLFFDDQGNATQVSHPTAEAWDLTKKAVGQSVERDAFGNRLPDSKSPGNLRINNASRSLTGALRDAIPGYGDALDASGDYLSMQGAFEAGQKHILDLKTTVPQVQNYVADLSPADLNAYKAGQANQLFLNSQNARLAPRMLNTPAVQGKLAASLGTDNAQTFMDGLQQEIGLAKSGARLMPGTGSITADALLAAGEQDHAANLAAALQGAKAVGQAATGNIGSAALSGISAVRHFAPDFLKSGGMTADVRNSLGQLLMQSPEDLAATLTRIQAGVPNAGGANASALARLLAQSSPQAAPP